MKNSEVFVFDRNALTIHQMLNSSKVVNNRTSLNVHTKLVTSLKFSGWVGIA